MSIIAHRGLLDRAPGNSLAAFRDALTLGVDGVELDVRLSRDGVPIVHHNWYLDEHVAQPVPFHTLSAAQLRAKTIQDDHAEFSQQHPIPTPRADVRSCPSSTTSSWAATCFRSFIAHSQPSGGTDQRKRRSPLRTVVRVPVPFGDRNFGPDSLSGEVASG